jgi:hypothetical protein
VRMPAAVGRARQHPQALRAPPRPRSAQHLSRAVRQTASISSSRVALTNPATRRSARGERGIAVGCQQRASTRHLSGAARAARGTRGIAASSANVQPSFGRDKRVTPSVASIWRPGARRSEQPGELANRARSGSAQLSPDCRRARGAGRRARSPRRPRLLEWPLADRPELRRGSGAPSGPVGGWNSMVAETSVRALAAVRTRGRRSAASRGRSVDQVQPSIDARSRRPADALGLRPQPDRHLVELVSGRARLRPRRARPRAAARRCTKSLEHAPRRPRPCARNHRARRTRSARTRAGE